MSAGPPCHPRCRQRGGGGRGATRGCAAAGGSKAGNSGSRAGSGLRARRSPAEKLRLGHVGGPGGLPPAVAWDAPFGVILSDPLSRLEHNRPPTGPTLRRGCRSRRGNNNKARDAPPTWGAPRDKDMVIEAHLKHPGDMQARTEGPTAILGLPGQTHVPGYIGVAATMWVPVGALSTTLATPPPTSTHLFVVVLLPFAFLGVLFARALGPSLLGFRLSHS